MKKTNEGVKLPGDFRRAMPIKAWIHDVPFEEEAKKQLLRLSDLPASFEL